MKIILTNCLEKVYFINIDKDYTDLIKKQEQIELENAIKMSMIIDVFNFIIQEEKKKLSLMEEEEYKLAIAVSRSLANNEVFISLKQDEEISLFDPSTLVKKGRNDDVIVNTNKGIKTQTPHGNLIAPSNTKVIEKSINTSNPVVSTNKKEFDFSHLNM